MKEKSNGTCLTSRHPPLEDSQPGWSTTKNWEKSHGDTRRYVDLTYLILRRRNNPESSHLPSGKRLHNYGKSPCFMGKLTISTGPCSITFCMFTRPGIFQNSRFGQKDISPSNGQPHPTWRHSHRSPRSSIPGFFGL